MAGEVLLGGVGLELWIGKQKEHVALSSRVEINLVLGQPTAATSAACRLGSPNTLEKAINFQLG